MNTRIPLGERSSRELVADLRMLADRTRGEVTSEAAFGDYEGVRSAVQAVSDELQRASDRLGLDSALAWELLSVREWLDSHLVAASALASPDIDPLTSIELMRRGLDAVIDSLSVPAP